MFFVGFGALFFLICVFLLHNDWGGRGGNKATAACTGQTGKSGHKRILKVWWAMARSWIREQAKVKVGGRCISHRKEPVVTSERCRWDEVGKGVGAGNKRQVSSRQGEFTRAGDMVTSERCRSGGVCK